MTTPKTHPTAPVDHVHVADLDACLAFVNTLELDGTEGVPQDHIPSLDAAIGWFAGRSLAHEATLQKQADGDPRAFLARVAGTRAAFREVWDATVEGRSPNDGALDVVNRTLRHVPSPELRATPAGIIVGHRHDEADPLGDATAQLAQALVDAIAEGDTSRFRVCANDASRWVFQDRSRGGRRRWCDMQSCGNRAKVRRYRSRHRADEHHPAAGGAAANATR